MCRRQNFSGAIIPADIFAVFRPRIKPIAISDFQTFVHLSSFATAGSENLKIILIII